MYYARFESVADYVFRFDTRIYLGDHKLDESGECVGAIVGKNPGSARLRQLGVLAPLDLHGDKMLPFVRNRFVAAYEKAGKAFPPNAFVQVWNLFYLCNADLGAACTAINSFANPPLCSTEGRKLKVVWFAWGGDDSRLNPFKCRFISGQQGGFYYSGITKSIVILTPSASDFAKHTQGMPKRPVVNHLAGVL